MAAKNAIVKGAFELWSLHVCEMRSKAWTIEFFFEYLCTLNTLQTRTILGQIKLGKQLPGGSK